MRDRLQRMSQGAATPDGPLPGIDVERSVPSRSANGTLHLAETIATLRSGVLPPAIAPRSWRSQGITVYDMDDARLERLAAFFKARGIKFGRRGQISLLAGAGIAALERLLDVDPTALLTIVDGTMRERKGKSAAERSFVLTSADLGSE